MTQMSTKFRPRASRDLFGLQADDVERLGAELDNLHRVLAHSLGARDATYIHRVITAQRALEVSARITIGMTRTRFGWLLGTAGLALAKIIENMEIGHNVMHGQWDWMSDPEIHSTTWEWDMVSVSQHWRHAHNYRHHVNTNIAGVDDDLGFGVMHVTTDRPWRPLDLAQPARAALLAVLFEWGIALQGYYVSRDSAATPELREEAKQKLFRKIRNQCAKDYFWYPILSTTRWRRTLTANATANVLRNIWAYIVIMCGHIPSDAARFTAAAARSETRGEWYVRQMAGSSDFRAGPILGFLAGHLSHQIEHHLFPTLPSNRLDEAKKAIEQICSNHSVALPTSSFLHQVVDSHHPVITLARPPRSTFFRGRNHE
ncbi:fatty acid desaturase family protein [Tsukamurella tyrosinosolvens]|uniref:fatty acid desaturase family protein n=1 Tax=Tsukamurella tyrosinosolvens TaxID=57704 RepID=UPI001FD241A1|nr:acyl-CoA desaturase [Tsukamurella tyrosinosolvens]